MAQLKRTGNFPPTLIFSCFGLIFQLRSTGESRTQRVMCRSCWSINGLNLSLVDVGPLHRIQWTYWCCLPTVSSKLVPYFMFPIQLHSALLCLAAINKQRKCNDFNRNHEVFHKKTPRLVIIQKTQPCLKKKIKKSWTGAPISDGLPLLPS